MVVGVQKKLDVVTQVIMAGVVVAVHRGILVQLVESELAGAVDSHKQVELAALDTGLGNVEVKVADRVGLEALFAWLLASSNG